MRRIETSGRLRWLVVGVVAVMLLGACGDDKKATDATADGPSKVSVLAGLNDQEDPNIVVTEFLPEAFSVKAGAAVDWRFVGSEPHTVTFFPPGQAVPSPDSAEGQALLAPSSPPVTTYDGKSVVSSGLLPQGTAPADPFVLTFPDAGEFTYVCIIHPSMTGTVTVVGDGSVVDTQPDINERADGELSRWLDEGRAAKKKLTDAAPKQVKNPDDTTTWTYEAGANTDHASVLAFAPATGEVRPGDSVTFVDNSLAPHTATFLAGGQPPQNRADPAVRAPTGPSPLTLKAVGGPFNSGVLAPAAPPDAAPPEAARSFTFVIPEAGTYAFVCLFHAASGMNGSIKAA